MSEVQGFLDRLSERALPTVMRKVIHHAVKS